MKKRDQSIIPLEQRDEGSWYYTFRGENLLTVKLAKDTILIGLSEAEPDRLAQKIGRVRERMAKAKEEMAKAKEERLKAADLSKDDQETEREIKRLEQEISDLETERERLFRLRELYESSIDVRILCESVGRLELARLEVARFNRN
jgi:hypothetical protein